MFTVGPAFWGGAFDPLYNQVQFLLSPQSMPLGAVANDQSSAARASTVSGGAVVSTTTPLFGGPTMRFPGASDYFSYSYVPSGLDTGPFCIEAWVYFDSTPGLPAICCHNVVGAAGYIFLYIDGADKVILNSNGSSITSVPLTQWVHLAVTSSAGGFSTKRYFINGVLDASIITSFASPINLTDMRVGNGTTGSGGTNLTGALGGLRVTVGSKRYADGGFAVPTAPFPIG